LAVDDSGGGAGFRSFAAFDVERVMNAIEDAVALPPNEVIVELYAISMHYRQRAALV
jgi:hypothetical protein